MYQEHEGHVHRDRSIFTTLRDTEIEVVNRRYASIPSFTAGGENVECYRAIYRIIQKESDPYISRHAYPRADFECAIDIGNLEEIPGDVRMSIIDAVQVIVQEALQIRYSLVAIAECGCVIASGETRDRYHS